MRKDSTTHPCRGEAGFPIINKWVPALREESRFLSVVSPTNRNSTSALLIACQTPTKRNPTSALFPQSQTSPCGLALQFSLVQVQGGANRGGSSNMWVNRALPEFRMSDAA